LGIAEIDTDLTYDGIVLNVTGQISGSTSITTKNFQEVYRDYGTGGNVTLDLSSANNFEYTANTNVTFSFTGAPSTPKGFGFTLVYNNGGGVVTTWPGTVLWAGGVSPALTAGGTDVLVFYTYDGGTSYYGFLSAANFS
jgi:hypothetical protein